jgi:hypothetical protein
MEYANHGSLRDFLHTNRPDTTTSFEQVYKQEPLSQGSKMFRRTPAAYLTGFAHQVANGMQFLSSKNVGYLIFVSSGLMNGWLSYALIVKQVTLF